MIDPSPTKAHIWVLCVTTVKELFGIEDMIIRTILLDVDDSKPSEAFKGVFRLHYNCYRKRNLMVNIQLYRTRVIKMCTTTKLILLSFSTSIFPPIAKNGSVILIREDKGPGSKSPSLRNIFLRLVYLLISTDHLPILPRMHPAYWHTLHKLVAVWRTLITRGRIETYLSSSNLRELINSWIHYPLE